MNTRFFKRVRIELSPRIVNCLERLLVLRRGLFCHSREEDSFDMQGSWLVVLQAERDNGYPQG
jgi:hypothetical protein